MKGLLSPKCGSKQYMNPAAVISDLQIVDLFGHPNPENFDGLIDSGADRSAVPLRACKELKLKVAGYVNAYGFDHISKTHPVYWVYIRAMGLDDILVKAYGVRERDTVLLGRDFLKKLLFVMNSRNSRWTLDTSTYSKTFWLRLTGIL